MKAKIKILGPMGRKTGVECPFCGRVTVLRKDGTKITSCEHFVGRDRFDEYLFEKYLSQNEIIMHRRDNDRVVLLTAQGVYKCDFGDWLEFKKGNKDTCIFGRAKSRT